MNNYKTSRTFCPRALSLVLAGGGALLAGTAAPAWPQQPQQAAEACGGIEEAIVTARRVEESLRETPVSVAAFTTRDIQQRGMSELGELSHYTPNLETRNVVAKHFEPPPSPNRYFVVFLLDSNL